MNKTQFFTLSSALLASTALSSAASAGTIGRYDTSNNFTTTPLTISNTVFSTTASDANGVTIGSNAANSNFGMKYTNNFSGTTRFTTEFTISGANFITAGLTTSNVILQLTTASNTSSVVASVSGSVACGTVTSLVNLFVVNDCAVTAGAAATGAVHGISFTGVTFNNASGLATAGNTISLSGKVYNPSNVSQIFEAETSGTIVTSAAPLTISVTAGAEQQASSTVTPVAFSSLANQTGNLTMTLASVKLSGTGALGNGLASVVGSTTAGTTSISVASSLLSSGAVRNVVLNAAAGGSSLSYLTAANFSGGTVTFSLTNTTWVAGNSVAVSVEFLGTTAIPAAVAGTVNASVASDQQSLTKTGATAAVTQGGFRAEVNTFNASTNGPFGSYLRVHNNNSAAGSVNITVRNDATGEVLGSTWTSPSIASNATTQFSAADIEAGAAIPTASRTGSYTLSISGSIVGYVQHILFDGNSVADLSGFRNAGSTSNNP